METIRYLTEEEMLCVAGGLNDDDEPEEMTVTGYQDDPFSDGGNDIQTCYLTSNTEWTCQGWMEQGGGFVQTGPWSQPMDYDRYARSNSSSSSSSSSSRSY